MGKRQGSGRRKRKKSSRGGRGRLQSGGDALEQLRGIEHAQAQRRAKGTKQIIDSAEKSRRRLEAELDRIENLDDAYEQFG